MSDILDTDVYLYLNLFAKLYICFYWYAYVLTVSASKKAHMSGLMFQNRYLTPLVFIVNLVGEYLAFDLQFHL